MVTSSIIVLFAIGLAASICLGIASKVFHVEEDPRVEAVLEALPGANCGGCGFAGCEGYAVAVLNDPDMPPNKCCAGGPDVAANVAQLSGKAAGDADPVVSFRRCVKDEGKVVKKYDYQGVPTCAAAALELGGGPDNCAYACIGFGDCVRACPFNAMRLDGGMVRIDPEACTGCGGCINTCPHDILELIPMRSRVNVFCSSKDKMKEVMAVCEAGCISCMKCVKKCPANAISQEGGLIRIDMKTCLDYGPECEEVCVEVCPRYILRRIDLLRDGTGMADLKPAELAAQANQEQPTAQAEA